MGRQALRGLYGFLRKLIVLEFDRVGHVMRSVVQTTSTHNWYNYIGVWGKGVLNGKCSARGPRKLSEAVADWGKLALNSVLLLLLLLLLHLLGRRKTENTTLCMSSLGHHWIK